MLSKTDGSQFYLHQNTRLNVHGIVFRDFKYLAFYCNKSKQQLKETLFSATEPRIFYSTILPVDASKIISHLGMITSNSQ